MRDSMREDAGKLKLDELADRLRGASLARRP